MKLRSTNISGGRINTRYGKENISFVCLVDPKTVLKTTLAQKVANKTRGTIPEESAKYKKLLCGGTIKFVPNAITALD
jgi:hypothetical protein